MADRLAFSTLGCPGASIEEIIGISRESSARAIELRCWAGEPVAPGSSARDIRSVRQALDDAGVEIVCLASYVEIASASLDPTDDLLWHVATAQALGAPFVRIFGTDDPDAGAHARAVQRMTDLAPTVAASGVTVLVETHDAFPTGLAVSRILDDVGSNGFGAIWDVVNPWRHGELPSDTARHLGRWLRHVQIKDVATPRDLTPVLPGTGDVPLQEILDVLDRAGYRGWLSLEWERAWYPEIEPLVEALAAARDFVP